MWVTQETLSKLRTSNSSTLSGESEHTLLMGVGGEENARYSRDATGVEMHGPGGDQGFTTVVHPPRLAVVDWDPPSLGTMALASRVLQVPGAEVGALCTVSHEGSAAANIEGASTLLWSAQVSAVGEVSVVVLNASPAAVDLPLGKLRVMVTAADAL